MPSPLQQFQKEHDERWEVMLDIPPWEVQSILHWLKNIFETKERNTGFSHSQVFDYGIIRSIETNNRIIVEGDLGIRDASWSGMLNDIQEHIEKKNFSPVLILIECVIKYVRDFQTDKKVKFASSEISTGYVLSLLELSLERGSKWRIEFTEGSEVGLIERTNPQLTSIAKELNVDHLTEAWNDAFAVKPNPEKAIEHAQKAIESVSSTSGLSKTNTGIYGNLIGDIRSHPDKYLSSANESYDLADTISKDPEEPLSTNERFANWLWNGLDLIQRTNPGRHPSDQTKGHKVSPEAGKQAVLVATVLCELISNSYIFKSKNKS